jgi:hypothetical protein
MTPGPQDAPNLDQDPLDIGEKGAEPSGECAMVEDRFREQVAYRGMCLQPGVEVKPSGMAEPNVVSGLPRPSGHSRSSSTATFGVRVGNPRR